MDLFATNARLGIGEVLVYLVFVKMMHNVKTEYSEVDFVRAQVDGLELFVINPILLLV